MQPESSTQWLWVVLKRARVKKMRNHIVPFSQISQPENTTCVSPSRVSCHCLQGLPAHRAPPYTHAHMHRSTGPWGKELGSPLAAAGPWKLQGEPSCEHGPLGRPAWAAARVICSHRLGADGGVWRVKQEAAMPVGGEGKMQRLGRGRRKG